MKCLASLVDQSIYGRRASPMGSLEKEKKKKKDYQCAICGERAHHFQVCCGHPMIECRDQSDLLSWEFPVSSKRA